MRVCVFLGLFVLFPALAEARTAVIDRLEASVNSNIILLSDVIQFRRTLRLRGQLDPLFSGTNLSKRGNNASDKEIVNFLIDEKLISQSSPVKDAQVEQQISSIRASNNIDLNTLKRALREQGFSYDDYFELIRTSVSKRNLIDREIRTKVHISKDDIKNYFYNRYLGSKASLAYQIRILTVTPENYKTAKDARNTIRRALETIRGGEPFAEVAKRFSDDPSASSGGDLGVLSSDEMSSTIRRQIKRLKVGEVSQILGDANSRFFILKLVDIKSGQEHKLKGLEEEIRNKLLSTEYQRQIGLWLDRQRAEAFLHFADKKSKY